MNKEIRLDLETQGKLLETKMAEMETFRGCELILGGGPIIQDSLFPLWHARTP
jgi:hypothetical protein